MIVILFQTAYFSEFVSVRLVFSVRILVRSFFSFPGALNQQGVGQFCQRIAEVRIQNFGRNQYWICSRIARKYLPIAGKPQLCVRCRLRCRRNTATVIGKLNWYPIRNLILINCLHFGNLKAFKKVKITRHLTVKIWKKSDKDLLAPLEKNPVHDCRKIVLLQPVNESASGNFVKFFVLSVLDQYLKKTSRSCAPIEWAAVLLGTCSDGILLTS